jgi:site-specific DNA-methyltransferase (adenine-specific)
MKISASVDKTGLELNKFYNVDSLGNSGMNKIKDKSIDIVFADLPFGTTQNKWDSVIPLNDYIEITTFQKTKNKTSKLGYKDYLLFCYENDISKKDSKDYWKKLHKQGLWTHYDRILKDDGVVLLCAQKPFDTMLHNSNIKNFRYEWIWEKTNATGFQNAKKMPMKAHENVLVFYKTLPYYNPIKTKGHTRKVSSAISKSKASIPKNYNAHTAFQDYDSTERYPRSVLKFSRDTQFLQIHPTQKPVEFYEYFIRTYCRAGAIVLDNCSGSGGLGIACDNIGDISFICMEKDQEHGYFKKSKERFNLNREFKKYVIELISNNSNLTVKQLIKDLSVNTTLLNYIEKLSIGIDIKRKIKKNIENTICTLKRNDKIKELDDGTLCKS